MSKAAKLVAGFSTLLFSISPPVVANALPASDIVKYVVAEVPDYDCQEGGCRWGLFSGKISIVAGDGETRYKISGDMRANCLNGKVELWKNGYHKDGSAWYSDNSRIYNKTCGTVSSNEETVTDDGFWDENDKSVQLNMCINPTFGSRHCGKMVITDMVAG